MLLSGGAARLLRGGGERAPQASVAAGSWASNGPYLAAITDLEQALQADRASGQLDSATVRVVQHNLAVIDMALAEARTALAADPASSYLNRHLANTMQRKLELLREATGLAVRQT